VGEDVVRGLANAGGGRLAIADIAMAPRPAAAPVPERDWGAVLGLELDATTGELRRPVP
jgi:hypothetical protein